jgi:carboxymethylenebutenolidase
MTLLPPLTRRGYGPGLIILQQDCDKILDIVDGVPSPLIKWAEEGYVVLDIQAKALKLGATEVITTAVKALQGCDELEPNSKIGIVGKSNKLTHWDTVILILIL